MYTHCSLALQNLVRLLSHLYSCGLIRADVLYGYLGVLRNRLAEPDVDMLVTVRPPALERDVDARMSLEGCRPW